jgi:uncharacterized membrane protein YcgQ (UPF0703/DUF1980 family)
MKKFLHFLTIATLLTWGGVFLFFYLTGRVEKHLDSSFRIYTLIAGVGMLMLGAFNFINRNRAVGLCSHNHAHGDDHDHHDHDHDHDHHHDDSPSTVFFSIIILLVPLLFATGYSKDQFSPQYLAKWGKIERQMLQMRIAEARSKRSPSKETVGSSVGPNANPYTSDAVGSVANPTDADTPPDPSDDDTNDSWATFTIEDLKQMVPQNEAGDFQLDVPQIFYTAGDIELMDVMEGIPIETTAQLMEETLNNPNGHRLKAFRLFIECCAADARPLSIPIDFGQGPPEYIEMGWYKLYGNLRYVEEGGELLPILQMERFEETTEPSEGLLF